MTLPEAERIVALDHDGKLDRSDAQVSKVVFEAHTVVQRAAMWGGSPGHPTRRRTGYILLACGLFLAVWIAGLLIPLLLGFDR
jgi:hypothetical protein